jgi:thiamine biosynthesis lipoprotein
VATSGDYERFFIKDGVRYHHIMDPETGFPARGSRSVTIVAEEPTGADGLSTAVFVMGADKGMKLVESIEGVEAVIVDSSGNVTVSLGLQESCTIIAPGPTS